MEYFSKFPNPPKFKSVSDKENFEVPKYYGFDHPCTKWILGSIVSNQALFRLLKVATNYRCILKRYHQIPDRPSLIMKDRYNGERAAFDSQAILYLTPLAISIYMKYEDALTQLVGLKDANGETIIDPNELCFVQNFWRKGDTRYFTDLIATFPAIIAIRRNYFTAFPYLLMAGYCPNDSFSITYRKPHREIVIFYRDLIDYVLDYLKRRPAFNVSKLMNVLLQTSMGSINNLDVFCFDSFPDFVPKLQSLFHRITRTLLDGDNLSEENGMHIINILEKIQEAGFFLGMRNSISNADAHHMELEDLLKQRNTNKLKSSDLQMLKPDTLHGLLKQDYRYSVCNLIIWLQSKLLRRKTEQTGHVLKLLTKILFDSELIEWFFKENTPSNEDLWKRLSDLPCLKDILELRTVVIIVNNVVQFYQKSEPMITNFTSRYNCKPISVLLGYTDTPKKIKTKKVNKNNWVKSEFADQTFRKKYLKCKENLNKKNLNENKSNSAENYNGKTLLTLKGSILQVENKLDQKLYSNQSHSDDFFYMSSKTQKFNSNSSSRMLGKTVDDSSIDLFINSIRSIATCDPNNTVSISNIFDLNNLTTIEIDMAEIKKSKRMCSEVLIAATDDDGYRKTRTIPDVLSSSTSVSNTLKNSDIVPPPLMEYKLKSCKKK